jgi:hypothetical protein
MNTYKDLFVFAYTSPTSRIRDWLSTRGYIAAKPNIGSLLTHDEQTFVEIPDYLLYYAIHVADSKIRKHNEKEFVKTLKTQVFNPSQFNPSQFNPSQFNPSQFNPSQFNPSQFNPYRYQILLYVFMKTDYPYLEKFIEYSRHNNFNSKVFRYSFQHRKYENLILETYKSSTYRDAISKIALRYGRFDILGNFPIVFIDAAHLMMYAASGNFPIVFTDAAHLMIYAVKSPKIFDFLEKNYKRLPIAFGLLEALKRDRIKMFQFLYEKTGPEIMVILGQKPKNNYGGYQLINNFKISSREAYECLLQVQKDMLFDHDKDLFTANIHDNLDKTKFNPEY